MTALILFNFLPYLIILSMIFLVLCFLKRFFALESKINKALGAQNQTIESLNKRITEQDQTIEGQNQTIEGQNQTIEDLNQRIINQNQKLENINQTVIQFINGSNEGNNNVINLNNNQNSEVLVSLENGIKLLKESNDKNEKNIKELKEELRHADLNIYLLQNYTKKIELKSNVNYDLLNNKYEYISDIYKLLLIRKISNQILENLFNGDNEKDYMKTQHKFKDSNNQKFPIIVAKNDILKIPKNKINQIIDFLMFLKEKCSNIIHFSDKSSVLQLELLTEILGGNITKTEKTEKSYLSATQALSILFDDLNAFPQNITINKLSDNDEEKMFLNQLKEELNKIKMEKLNEDSKNNETSLLLTENRSEETVENTSQSQNNNGNTVFNTIRDILYPNKNQKEIILGKIEKSMELLSTIQLVKNDYENLNASLKGVKDKRKYDISFLFLEWKNSFKQGYRREELFQKLVKLEKDITIESIKNNLTVLVPNLKIEIFHEDFHNFTNNISSTLNDKEIDNYSN